MPYKSEKIRLSEQQDRRRKLTEEQKEEIRTRYACGDGSHRSLATEYNVSKSMICIIVNPKRAEAVQNRAKEHWQDYVPSKADRAAIQREHRYYKHDLYLKGELTE